MHAYILYLVCSILTKLVLLKKCSLTSYSVIWQNILFLQQPHSSKMSVTKPNLGLLACVPVLKCGEDPSRPSEPHCGWGLRCLPLNKKDCVSVKCHCVASCHCCSSLEGLQTRELTHVPLGFREGLGDNVSLGVIPRPLELQRAERWPHEGAVSGV